MIVSWNWLTDYLRLDMPVEALTERLALTGLNLESIADVGGDLAIDLEVTSNRPDCLGHLGVAREIAVLFDKAAARSRPAARRPRARRSRRGPAVTVEDRDALPAVHRAGDLGREGRREPLVAAQAAGDDRRPADQQHRRRDQLRHVRVRPAAARLRPRPAGRAPAGRPPGPSGRDAHGDQQQGLRADARDAGDRRRRAAGRPGGRDGRRSRPRSVRDTTNVLIEAAQFDAMSVRRTSRALGLFSPSSFRFERPLDPEVTEWASRRCAELILKVAGGTLHPGVIDVGRRPAETAGDHAPARPDRADPRDRRSTGRASRGS